MLMLQTLGFRELQWALHEEDQELLLWKGRGARADAGITAPGTDPWRGNLLLSAAQR